MEKKDGLFRDGKGNASSTRVIGFIAVLYALLQSTLILYLGHIEGVKVIVTAAASSSNFLAIAGPAMIYLFNNKKEEGKVEIAETKIEKVS